MLAIPVVKAVAFKLAPAASPVLRLGVHAVAVLALIGHSRFCPHYPDDCEDDGIDFRRRNIVLTLERWNELNAINRSVNRYCAEAQ